ncbi:hydroxypyruvate isomerase family protein [Allorhodopirellula solitaria]|uniref:Hydroxypyruvate isomerase n=1 Tax=Allorhodopirellula solitaria TaxID=2527987 RepID=A0A5C5XW32_9BACT|nr:TIM barrel protein [Allorhodopirellula solitaria]TWT67536.1 Hydroxypyruvate isomerase [Allorhodopirellula solitaria]
MNTPLSRRSVLTRTLASAAGAATIAGTTLHGEESASGSATNTPVNAKSGRLNQSVCKWCYRSMSLEDLAVQAAELGLVGIDLLGPADFPTLKKHGLVCTMVGSHALTDGLCDTKYHDQAIEKINAAIEATSAEGWKNVICFSGNARGIDRKTGMKNCVDALRKVVPVAEAANVTLQMELLNSKVDHADYMCDNSEWGVELVKQVGSDNFKLLYDIYHMQIMEGDIIRTIEKNHPYYGHYHTAGNPGRHELDDTQELFYPPIAQAIAETGYQGYFAHEFIPAGDPMTGLRKAVAQCTV